jgi:adenine-specific DNA-methyltransferase
MKTKTPTSGESPEPSDLSAESVAYLKQRPKSERSPLGQFLTPRSLREELVGQVPLAPGMRVLDPGVGTGEFLKTCLEHCSLISTTGWDVDPAALEVAKNLVPSAQLHQRSALEKWDGEPFDVVIGNPPYFEMRDLDPDTRSEFRNVISGRPNIFSLFFEAGFRVLKDGGYLAYVVPPSMNNGAYFDRLRNFILKHFSIEFFRVFDNPFLFEDAQTAVQLIVLKKGSSSNRYWLDLGDASGSPKKRKVFVEKKEEFLERFKGKPTLYRLGYQAVTGSVVWNTRKQDLRRHREDDSIPLIWAHNIGEGREISLQEDHPKRPQYVNHSRPQLGPAIVVNRITGSVGSGSLRCAVVPEGMEYVAENHVNVIVPRQDADQLATWDEVLDALRSPSINERVRLLTGNTQISATELTHWIPLDV